MVSGSFLFSMSNPTPRLAPDHPDYVREQHFHGSAATKKKIYIALPTYSNNIRRDFFLSLMDVVWGEAAQARFSDCAFTLGTIGGDGVGRSRNNLTQQFLLATECEYIVFLDVDIIFTWEHLRLLVDALSPQRPIVGGRYACKSLNHRWIMTELPGEAPDPATGLQRVQECGTGFKGYHRSYFEAVMNAFPEIQYLCDGSQERFVKWDFFSMGVVDGRYLSEDYYADWRARKIGMDIYVQTKIEVQHQGFIGYPLNSNFPVLDGMKVNDVFELAKAMGNTPAQDHEALTERSWDSAEPATVLSR